MYIHTWTEFKIIFIIVHVIMMFYKQTKEFTVQVP